MAFSFMRKIKEIKNQLADLGRKMDDEKWLLAEQYLDNNLRNNPKYTDSKRLNKFEYQSFSQFGEDGIIREIFERIGTTNKYFVEFGVENGLECNSTALLYKQWQGLWIEGSKEHCTKIQSTFSDFIGDKKLTILNEFITAENIESLFKKGGVPQEMDILSIDIDYNDYYVWDAIKNYSPRLVIIEYNPTFSDDTHYVVPYNASRTWDGTSFFSASLLAYQQLAESKGYCLVGCTFAGTNAFFVRKDLVGDKFEAPYTAKNHFEPIRYALFTKAGHPRNHRPA